MAVIPSVIELEVGPSSEIAARLDEIKARAARYVAEFLPRNDDGVVEGFLGPAHRSRDDEFYKSMIAEPAWHLLARGGKRWRAVLAVLLLEAFGVPDRRFERDVVLIAEFIHTGSLIVDDIEDNSALRRGVMSTHLAFGTDVALNAGNIMYFLPLMALEQNEFLSIEQRAEIYRVIISYFVRSHLGQANDIYYSHALFADKLEEWYRPEMGQKILEMYVNKTAACLMGLVETTAIMADVGPDVRAACLEFVRVLGVAFQIMDDICGLSGMPGSTETSGEDLAAGKLTYINHIALRRLGETKRKRLAEILSSRLAAENPEALQEAMALVTESGALERCRAEARTSFARQWRLVRNFLPPSSARTMLRAMSMELLSI